MIQIRVALEESLGVRAPDGYYTLRGVSLLHPQPVGDGGLLHLATNFQATSSLERRMRLIPLSSTCSPRTTPRWLANRDSTDASSSMVYKFKPDGTPDTAFGFDMSEMSRM